MVSSLLPAICKLGPSTWVLGVSADPKVMAPAAPSVSPHRRGRGWETVMGSGAREPRPPAASPAPARSPKPPALSQAHLAPKRAGHLDGAGAESPQSQDLRSEVGGAFLPLGLRSGAPCSAWVARGGLRSHLPQGGGRHPGDQRGCSRGAPYSFLPSFIHFPFMESVHHPRPGQ